MTHKLLNILKDSDPYLRIICKPISSKKELNKYQTLINNMVHTMIESNGVGLAANQVGESVRIITLLREDETILKMINPVIIYKSDETIDFVEGCLSVDDVSYSTGIRDAKISVSYRDENFNLKDDIFEGRDSVCLQHEIDHLNGILFTDYPKRIFEVGDILQSKTYPEIMIKIMPNPSVVSDREDSHLNKLSYRVEYLNNYDKDQKSSFFNHKNVYYNNLSTIITKVISVKYVNDDFIKIEPEVLELYNI